MLTTQKKRRGRPRKNIDKTENIRLNKTKPEENIVVYFEISDDDIKSETNKEDVNEHFNDDTDNDNNCFTANDDVNDDMNNEQQIVLQTVSEIEPTNYQTTIKQLMDEIKLKDKIIANLKNKQYNVNKLVNITYHYVQLADETNNIFKPKNNNIKCWWCDEYFDNLPAYIVNYLRKETYYVFGNFCSFNCALKYNVKMLNDFKCGTRHALTNNLRIKVTNDDKQIKLAGDRELLKTKGGQYSIEQFRNGFSVVTEGMRMSMPPIMPLVHVIE
jgi:hypothetical protein